MCTTEQKPQAPGHQSDLCDSGYKKSRVRFSQQSMVTRVTYVIQGMKNPGFVFHNSQCFLGIYVGGDKQND